MKLKGIRIQRLKHLYGMQRSIFVEARQFVEGVGVFRILGKGLVQVRNRFVDAAGRLQGQSQVILCAWMRLGSFQLVRKTVDRLRKVIFPEIRESQKEIDAFVLWIACHNLLK